jgi:ABC-type Fe3+-hydroxamate transport system substrate-binding protein
VIVKRFILCILFFVAIRVYPCNVIDDAGNQLTLVKPAHHIISLAPDITEDLFAINAGNHIVGVIQGSDYPVAANYLPQVGNYANIDVERIIRLHPDLIITWGNNFARQLLTSKQLAIPIYISNPQHLADIPHTLINLGCLTGNEKSAAQAANDFNQQLIHLRQSSRHPQNDVRVFFQLGEYSLLTINKNSWINQVIELCHGKNIFADAKFTVVKVDWEAMVDKNPQLVIASAPNNNWQQAWQPWQSITAVKYQHFVTINPDLVERASPRLTQGAAQLCQAI